MSVSTSPGEEMSLSRLKGSAIRLILDWDGTLTTKDTMHVLPSIAFHSQARRQIVGDKPSLTARWNRIVRQYTEDFNAHVSSYTPMKPERKSIAQEKKWLASLKQVETRSVERVERSGLFRGVTAEDVRIAASAAIDAGEVKLRVGWSNLLLTMYRRGQHELEEQRASSTSKSGENSSVRILSVNWSSLFIKECLCRAASACNLDQTPGSGTSKNVLNDALHIISISGNEIKDLDYPGGSSGHLSEAGREGIRTSEDKLACMAQFHYRLDKSKQQDSLVGNPQSISIYVGDSPTDFDCLLASDIGICIRDNPMGSSQSELAETLERVGVPVLPLGSFAGVSRGEGTEVLYWAEDLNEVTGLIENHWHWHAGGF